MNIHICLYFESTPQALNIRKPELVGYLRARLPQARISARAGLAHRYLSRRTSAGREGAADSLAARIASIKVRNINKNVLSEHPLPGEVQYEKRRLLGQTDTFGMMYEGFSLMALYRDVLPRAERTLRHVHIVLTNQLFVTWQEDDRRFHARDIICGVPSLISTTGLVEAPARPREYYLLKQQYQSIGLYDAAAAALAPKFQGRFIDHADQRMTEVIKGYVMQAFFHHFTGEAFCDDRDCRLYNAHWQEELIHAQVENRDRFCARHRRVLKDTGRGG